MPPKAAWQDSARGSRRRQRRADLWQANHNTTNNKRNTYNATATTATTTTTTTHNTHNNNDYDDDTYDNTNDDANSIRMTPIGKRQLMGYRAKGQVDIYIYIYICMYVYTYIRLVEYILQP